MIAQTHQFSHLQMHAVHNADTLLKVLYYKKVHIIGQLSCGALWCQRITCRQLKLLVSCSCKMIFFSSESNELI